MTDDIDTITPATAEQIATLAAASKQPVQLEDGEIYAVAHGNTVQILTTPAAAAEQADIKAGKPALHCRQNRVTDATSFITRVQELTDTDEHYALGEGRLELWADVERHRLTAVIDGIGGFANNIVTLVPDTTDAWDEWGRIDGQLLSQLEFAEFIEDHISTIAEPDGAVLLDICQTLTANTKVHFKSSDLLANGQRQFAFEETIEAKAGAKGTLKVPSTLTLALAPVKGTDPASIGARFRYRIHDGDLRLGVKLMEPKLLIDTAFNEMVAAIDESFTTPIIDGAI